jgi:hypothetical protein
MLSFHAQNAKNMKISGVGKDDLFLGALYLNETMILQYLCQSFGV